MFDVNNTPVFEEGFMLQLSQSPASDRNKIARQIWEFPSVTLSTDEAATSAAFFEHLRNEIAKVQFHQQLFSFCTFNNLISMVGVLRNLSSHPLEEVVRELQRSFSGVGEESIRRSLEFCVRLQFTLNVNTRAIAVGTIFRREQALDWNTEDSFSDLLKQTFVPNTAARRASKIDGGFDMEHLVNRCGLQIEWTNYLTDHLRLDINKRVLLVYKHKVYLSNGLKEGTPGLLPVAVLGEALDTLNLLFPFGDPSTQQFLAQYNENTFSTLGSCGRERILDLSHFKYWRHELEALLDIYNSPPRTWKQLALDRRNKLEWSAFWVTMMVAFLTLVSIPCSIIQAVYSVKAYHLALTQINGLGGDGS